jgi:hypothetical protein
MKPKRPKAGNSPGLDNQMTRMKLTHKLTLTATAIVALILAQSAQAAGAVRSPKLASQQTTTAAGFAQDPDLAHPGLPQIYWSPKMAANLPRTASRTQTADPDLVHPRGLAAGKHHSTRTLQAGKKAWASVPANGRP